MKISNANELAGVIKQNAVHLVPNSIKIIDETTVEFMVKEMTEWTVQATIFPETQEIEDVVIVDGNKENTPYKYNTVEEFAEFLRCE